MKAKKCAKCGKTLPATEFSKDKSKPDGLEVRCRECKREYMRAYNEAHKTLTPGAPLSAARTRRRAAALQQQILGGGETIQAQLISSIEDLVSLKIDVKYEPFVRECERRVRELRGELIKSRSEVFDLKRERAEDIDRDIDKGING